MKKWLACLLAVWLLSAVGTVFAAETDAITVKVNGELLQTDVAPIMENDRILLPMRAIFEKLGCNVSYREADGSRYVTAFHGDTQILLEIGKNEITVNGAVKPLDVAAKIENDRTLVPVRAVSEALKADVSWDGETRTAEVTTKQGEHKIRSVADEKVVRAADGTALMYINVVYPVFEGKQAYIEQINAAYKAEAEKFIADAQEKTADAQELFGEMGKDFLPFEYNLSYDVHTDKNGILSVTSYAYFYLDGAHPDTERVSKTFDLNNAKELTLSDIVNGDADEIHTMVYDVFVQYFEENSEDFSAEAAQELDKECDNVSFYLTDHSLVLYFDVYEVASYAAGYPTVELAYSDGLFKIDLSESNSFFDGGNYTDEMKMPVTYDYADHGASAVERKGDHVDSPYFSRIDFYNAKPTDTLVILPHFQTMQQTSWWSCGVCCAEMVLNYYGKLGDWNEKTLADLRSDHSQMHLGTCVSQLIEIFEKVGGFDIETTYDYLDDLDSINADFIKQRLADGIPLIIGWNDWGGHWQVIIGYDDMGTEYAGDDVIIVADPFDTTDHNQDGYGVYGAERVLENFTFFDFFHDEEHPKDKCFVAVKPKA